MYGKMRWIALLLVCTALLGCQGKAPPAAEPVPPDIFEVKDEYIQGVLDEKLLDSDSDVVVYNEEINLQSGESSELIYAVKNRDNSTDICIYTQVVCTTVLTGDGCDVEARMQNTNYFWKWFAPPSKKLVLNGSTVYLKAKIKDTVAENVFLGQIVVWYMETPNEKCPSVDTFSIRGGIKEYDTADFLLSLE